MPEGLGYRLETTWVAGSRGDIRTSRVVFDSGPVSLSADAALARAKESASDRPIDAAMTFLRDQLRNGPKGAKDILEAAEGEDITEGTMVRARRRLRIAVKREGFGPGGQWVWSLPE
jgi:putative DNA primase/helicase